MKSPLLYPLCVVTLLAACHSGEKSKTTDSDTVKTEAATHVAPVQANLPENFYKRLQGIIGNKNVIVNLSRSKTIINGTYDYNNIPTNITLEKMVSPDSIILLESVSGEAETAKAETRLYLKWTGTAFNGTRVSGKEKLNVHLEENYTNGSYRFNTGDYEATAKAYPKKEDSPEGTVNYGYLMSEGSSPQQKWLDGELRRLIGIPKSGISWEAGIKAAAASYLKGYKTDIKSLGSDTELSATLNYSQSQALNLQYNGNDFVIIEHFVDAYTGGAHNNYSSSMVCLDVKKQRRLGIADVLKFDSVAMQQVVEKNFRIQYKLKPEEPLKNILFEDHLPATNNFFFDSKGISFLYNPYEVAAFAQGQITVSVPYTDLKQRLQPEFVKRMQIK